MKKLTVIMTHVDAVLADALSVAELSEQEQEIHALAKSFGRNFAICHLACMASVQDDRPCSEITRTFKAVLTANDTDPVAAIPFKLIAGRYGVAGLIALWRSGTKSSKGLVADWKSCSENPDIFLRKVSGSLL